jgi:hypothetical protein
MTLELDHKDLVKLVLGTEPYYNIMEHALIKNTGHFVGGFVDEWRWNVVVLNKLSDERLVEIFKLCKQSWK